MVLPLIKGLLNESLLNEDSVRISELPANLRKKAAALLRSGRAYYDSEKKEVRSTKHGDCCVPVNDSPAAIKQALGEGTRFIHLQGLGKVPAILARELKPGDILSWNQSPDSYQVVDVKEVSKQFLSVTQKHLSSGKTYETRMKKDKLVAAKRKK